VAYETTTTTISTWRREDVLLIITILVGELGVLDFFSGVFAGLEVFCLSACNKVGILHTLRIQTRVKKSKGLSGDRVLLMEWS